MFIIDIKSQINKKKKKKKKKSSKFKRISSGIYSKSHCSSLGQAAAATKGRRDRDRERGDREKKKKKKKKNFIKNENITGKMYWRSDLS